MCNKRFRNIFIIIILCVAAAFGVSKIRTQGVPEEKSKEVSPTIGTIQTFISTTGTVLPKNRLEVKPPVNGRIESILVQEGEAVKAGQTLAWMSSTERAALLDAAQGQGEEQLKYWKEVYKSIPLLSPIDGQVIVATTQPGQTVATSDAIVVLSDHLIVRAQVDETDIGKVALKQEATITLDAYSDTRIKANVEHIYYESKTINNVTIYEVDLLPQDIPTFFRSGMNATVDFIENSKKDVLLIPTKAILTSGEKSFVLVKESKQAEPAQKEVTVGIADGQNTEILSGITSTDIILMKPENYKLPELKAGSNPFLPKMPSRKKNSSLP